MDFKDKTAVITGAGQGIGKGVAESFLRCGANVVIADLHSDRIGKLLSEYQDTAHFCRTDLSEETSIQALMAETQSRFGGLDYLVNNARPRIERTKDPVERQHAFMDGWDLGLNIMLRASAWTIQYAVPMLGKSSCASVVNMVSTNAIFVAPQPMVYHVSKAGLIQMTRFLAYDLGPLGIRVNAVAPGIVDIHDDSKPLTSVPLNKKTAQIAVPLQRAAEVEEIASTILYLCSPASSYVTGQVLLVDGGITLGDQFHVARNALQSKE